MSLEYNKKSLGPGILTPIFKWKQLNSTHEIASAESDLNLLDTIDLEDQLVTTVRVRQDK